MGHQRRVAAASCVVHRRGSSTAISAAHVRESRRHVALDSAGSSDRTPGGGPARQPCAATSAVPGRRASDLTAARYPRLASVTAPDYRTGLRLRRQPPGHRRAQADSWPKVIAWQRSDPPATGPAAFTRAVHNNPGRLIRRPARTARQPRSGRETPQVVVTTRNIGRCHPAGHGSRRVVDLGNCRKSFPNHRRDRCRLRVRRTRRWDQSERGVRHGRNSFSTF